jgi:S1-C subfamily serine protease
MSMLAQLSSELEELVARTSPGVVAVEHRRGQGTGTVLTPDGYVLTNSHVVRSAEEIKVDFSSGESQRAHVVGRDDRTDLAVVRVDSKSQLVSLPLADRARIKVGQLVVAIGNPLSFDRSVSLGVVSALDRSLNAGRGALLEGLIQTDAAINPGNSGGPLVDVEGKVVGINTAIIPFAQGIGFAVPAHTANWIAAVLIQRGHIRRPFIGIAARSEELPHTLSKDLGQPRAVRVLSVGDDSPADRAGLHKGDMLLTVNGSAIGSIDDIQRIMVLSDARDVEIALLRGEKRQAISVKPSWRENAAEHAQ